MAWVFTKSCSNPASITSRWPNCQSNKCSVFWRRIAIVSGPFAPIRASATSSCSRITALTRVPRSSTRTRKSSACRSCRSQVVDRLHRSRKFFAQTAQCLACTLIAQEREQQCRIVAETSAFIAFIPYAALSPYHVWIFPKIHAPCFSEMPPEHLPELAAIVRTILAKMFGLLKNPAFNLVVRSLVPREDDSSHFHWYISIVARVVKVAGFELGTGMYVNPSAPEVSAQALRDFCEG